ncbi:MAG: class II aldolase/adducin family protein [Candidatus Limnocylindrales bacterium]
MTDPIQNLITELTEVGRDAVGRGLVLASGGNLSARIPDRDAYVLTAAGTWLDRLVPDDFTVMDMDGHVIGGSPKPSSEWKLHWRTYQVRPDVNSVIHLHPQTAVLLDALGYKVQLITLDHANYLRNVERVPFNHNGSDELADTSAEASRSCNAVIQAYHGCSTLGDTVAMAYRRALNLEEAAANTFRCIQLGHTDATFPPDAFKVIHHL